MINEPLKRKLAEPSSSSNFKYLKAKPVKDTQSNKRLHLFLLFHRSANTFTFKRHMRLFSANRRSKVSISNFSNVKLFYINSLKTFTVFPLAF